MSNTFSTFLAMMEWAHRLRTSFYIPIGLFGGGGVSGWWKSFMGIDAKHCLVKKVAANNIPLQKKKEKKKKDT